MPHVQTQYLIYKSEDLHVNFAFPVYPIPLQYSVNMNIASNTLCDKLHTHSCVWLDAEVRVRQTKCATNQR